MKPALLVIDVQKAFYKWSPQTAQSLSEAVDQINAAIELFRTRDLPIFCIQHMNEKEKFIPGDEGFDVPEELAILPTDPHIYKTYSNAFNKTSLRNALRKREVDTVIITGFSAEYCVLSTYRGAADLEFKAIILRDSLASDTPENIKFVENISEVISFGALKQVLG